VVLIVGGGIAGAAAALALDKAGIDVIVHEAHPESSADAGAFLTLAENGMRALQQIDADGVVAEASAPLRTMRVSSADGTEIATATFADGTRTSADLLIGADGLRSTVRSVLDPDGATPRYVGQRVFYGYADDTGVSGDPDRIHFVRDSQRHSRACWGPLPVAAVANAAFAVPRCPQCRVGLI